MLIVYGTSGQTRTCELQVPLHIEQYVLGLKVAIDDVLAMQILEDEHNLCCVELGDVVVEACAAAEPRKELAPHNILKHEVQVLGICIKRIAITRAQKARADLSVGLDLSYLEKTRPCGPRMGAAAMRGYSSRKECARPVI